MAEIMKFSLTLESGNDDNGSDLVGDVLRHVAQMVDDGFLRGPLTDRNGNPIGSWSFEPADEEEDDESEMIDWDGDV